MDLLESVYIWFISLGDNYGINPLIFGAIYIGSIPFFTLSVGWTIRNYNKGSSIVIPLLSASFFYVSIYLYLIIAGENIPFWVYAAVLGMLLYGGWFVFKKVKNQIERKEPL